jgi:uncharacterized protein YneF (UPF0154 family)
MKTRSWIILLVVLVLIAFAIGYFLSTIKTAYTNRDKIKAGIDIVGNLPTLLG